jgi:hypothetical protein
MTAASLRCLSPGLICEGGLRGSGLARTRAGFGLAVADGHGLGVECHGAVPEGGACGGVGSADRTLGHACSSPIQVIGLLVY